MWMTLDKMVRRICLLRDDPAAKGYVKTAAAVSQAIMNMQLSSFPNVKTVDYVVGNDLTVPIGDGTAVVGKVGLVKSDNVVMCRELDSIGLNFRKTEVDRLIECCDDEETVVVSSSNQTDWNCFSNYTNRNGVLGEMYGISSGDNRPCYSVDYRGCRIVFGSEGINIGDVVLVEVSLLPGHGEEEDITIPVDAFDMVYHYACAYLDDHKNFNLAQGRRVAAGSAKRIFDFRHGGFNLEDIYFYYRSGYTLTPSR
jgi:hypothetical protein